jgi:transaldolase
MTSVDQLRVKIFADGADFDGMLKLYANPHVRGFTTNPSLMRKAGVADYEGFARKVLKAIPDRPVSLEVFADDFDAMERQARAIASWGPNVNVKIPVTNTRGEFAGPLVKRLSDAGVVVNVTAIFTLDQVRRVVDALNPNTGALVSVFAGRIADTGVDPVPVMAECVSILKRKPKSELIWASPREVLNVVQAHEIGCHIITVTPDMIAKFNLLGKDHERYSLETVETFYRDASAAGYTIATAGDAAPARVAAS